MTVSNVSCQPNFFLIGAAKCGTTSVAKYLDQHPEVFVSKPKEPNFFSFEPDSIPTCRGPVDSEQLYELLLKYSITSPGEYHDLYSDAQGMLAVGEASVRYLYEAHAVARIAEYSPSAKLIVVLRDPVDRLYSHYHMNLRQHIEPMSLQDAIAAENERVELGWGWDWHYRRVSLYGEQIQRVYQYFDKSQLLVLFHKDLKKKPQETMQAIFRHLGVSSTFKPDVSTRAMVGHTPRWPLLRRLIRDENVLKSVAKKAVPIKLRKSFAHWSESKNRQKIPPLVDAQRHELYKLFSKDSLLLAELLGRQLPW